LFEKPYDKLSFISDLVKIPVKAESYDLVFCSQTLEHVPDPQLLLSELYRVLKPGGKLWLSVPFFYAEHEIPYDYYRYTRYGIAYLFEKVGIQIESITWLEGYYGTLAYQLWVGATALPVKAGDYGGKLVGGIMAFFSWFIKLLFFIMSILFTNLDIRHKYSGGGMCKNYAVVAQKSILSNHNKTNPSAGE